MFKNIDFKKMYLTFFYVGLIKKAPGTFGSLAALPFGIFILEFLHPSNLFFLGILVGVLAIKMIDSYEKENNLEDPKEVVIDEVSGQWIAMSLAGGSMLAIALSFLFFRIFDIWKPSVIGKIDRELKGGKGVVLDDMVAGVFGGIVAAIIAGIIERLL